MTNYYIISIAVYENNEKTEPPYIEMATKCHDYDDVNNNWDALEKTFKKFLRQGEVVKNMKGEILHIKELTFEE